MVEIFEDIYYDLINFFEDNVVQILIVVLVLAIVLLGLFVFDLSSGIHNVDECYKVEVVDMYFIEGEKPRTNVGTTSNGDTVVTTSGGSSDKVVMVVYDSATGKYSEHSVYDFVTVHKIKESGYAYLNVGTTRFLKLNVNELSWGGCQ